MCDLCRAEGNRIGSKFRSVESFRSNHKSPEVLTFDELVERSLWSVELAERQEESEAEFPDFPFSGALLLTSKIYFCCVTRGETACNRGVAADLIHLVRKFHKSPSFVTGLSRNIFNLSTKPLAGRRKTA